MGVGVPTNASRKSMAEQEGSQATLSCCTAQWSWPSPKGRLKGSSTPRPPSSMVAPRARAAKEANPLSFCVSPLLLFLMAADVAPAGSGGGEGAAREGRQAGGQCKPRGAVDGVTVGIALPHLLACNATLNQQALDSRLGR